MTTNNDNNQSTGEFILYQTEDGRTRIECRFENETIWLTQALMAELFQVTVPTVNEHLKGIYADMELSPEATIRNFRIVRREGARQVSRDIEHYNLEAILAVGFRVRSHRGTQFRIWATRATIRKFRIAHAAAPTCMRGLQVRDIDNARAPFSQHGGLGKVHQLFGDKLNAIIEELNETLAA